MNILWNWSPQIKIIAHYKLGVLTDSQPLWVYDEVPYSYRFI